MDLERLTQRLVAALEARDPGGIHRPIPVAELRERVLPYRLYRTALGLTNYEDYELLILRLVAEEGGWVRTFPPEAAERARREVAERVPDLDLAEALGDATIQIGAATLGRLKTKEEPPAAAEPSAEPPAAEPSEPPEPIPAEPPPVPAQSASLPVEAPAEAESSPAGEPEAPVAPPPPPIPLFEALDAAGPATARPPAGVEPVLSSCLGCGTRLPEGRTVVFCPHCGQQVGTLRCPRCGTELEAGWRHCVMCGHRVAGVDAGLA